MTGLPKRYRQQITSMTIILVVALWCLGPILWIGVTSLKPQGTEMRAPVEFWPQEPTLDNYRLVTGERFTVQRSVLNSVIISGTAMIGTLLLATSAAYAIARLRFRSRYQSLYLMQIAGMVPPIVIIAPTFVLLRWLGLLRTYWAMILPNMVYSIPLASFLIAGYLSSVPFEIEDSGKVDGAGTFTIIFRLIFPVAAPGIFSAGILAFMSNFGEFMLANVVSFGERAIEPVTTTIMSLSRAFELQWTWVAAATIVTMSPIVVFVIVFQRVLVQGLTAGGIR